MYDEPPASSIQPAGRKLASRHNDADGGFTVGGGFAVVAGGFTVGRGSMSSVFRRSGLF